MIRETASALTNEVGLTRVSVPLLTGRRTPRHRSLAPGSPDQLRAVFWTKSIADYLIASLMLIVCLPIIAFCCLLVWLTSRGPAIYRQERVGQYGRVFTIYKIRTMYVDCERHTGPQWAKPGDPRVTLVGKVLRALHLDELPQIFNVLRGEMSLIGPRPERPQIAAKLNASIPGYDRRVMVKPGVSGFAQIHLPPDTNLTSVRNKLVLDFYYLRNLSTWFDCKIFLATALKMFHLYPKRGLGAIPDHSGAEEILSRSV